MAANQLDRTSIDIRGLTNAQASVYDSPARSSTNLGLGTAGLVQRFVGTRFTASALPVRQHQERKLVIRYSQVLLTGARRTYSYHGILYSICLCFRLPFDDAKAALSTRLRASTKSEMCEANDSQKALHEGHAVSRESYGLVLRTCPTYQFGRQRVLVLCCIEVAIWALLCVCATSAWRPNCAVASIFRILGRV